MLPRSASEVKSQQLCGCWEPMDPQNGCPFCILLQFLIVFFWGGPASLTLAMPEFETKCLHVRNVERLPLICWEFDTVSEVEHPGLAS